MKSKILVSRAVFPEVLARLSEHFDVESNPADRISAELIQACPQLKAVCNMAVGYNNVDVSAATAAGIMVTNTPDVLNETTADFGWALLMATARRVTESEHYLRAGKWEKWTYDGFLGADVHGATLGVIGMGPFFPFAGTQIMLGFGHATRSRHQHGLVDGDRKSVV